MATPIHEIMAESSAGMARERARRGRRRLPNTPPPGWSPGPAVGNTVDRRRSGRGFVGDASQMGRDLSGIMNPVLRRPAVGNTAGRSPWTPGSTGNMLYSTPEENENNRLSSGILNTSPANNLMAKIYNNQMPGMVNRPDFWFDSLTPEAKAINKVLNMPGMEGMRQGAEGDWNYKDFREKVPENLWNELPEDAFETLSDFRNQGYITT